jgi:hypothetical protein
MNTPTLKPADFPEPPDQDPKPLDPVDPVDPTNPGDPVVSAEATKPIGPKEQTDCSSAGS